MKTAIPSPKNISLLEQCKEVSWQGPQRTTETSRPPPSELTGETAKALSCNPHVTCFTDHSLRNINSVELKVIQVIGEVGPNTNGPKT